VIGSHNTSNSDRRPPSWRARIGQIALPATHLLALWAFAVAQPLYDILQRNGEFFIAHRTEPLDLILFSALVSVGLPLLLVLPWALLAAMWSRGGHVALTGLIGLLGTALASQLLAHRVALPTWAHFALAGALGVAVAWTYATRATMRSFMTMLSPSVLVFPGLFLLHPSMSLFVQPDTRSAKAAATITGPAPPIVFMIFDQLPVASLMDSRGQIDRDRYPGFAALAERATWYRNASTVADFTGWAVPPILSGEMPSQTRVPTTKSYPHNLFTWLGSRYRFEVQEPITQLCPERLCDANRPPLPMRMASMALDSSVVYLTVALPAGLRTHLPPLTENWKDFIQDQRWQRRWISQRDQDRRQVPRSLVASISRSDAQPTLYYAHSLLPHEPYVYLRSGQEFADPRLIGLNRTGRWTDPWPATVAYQRHLLQLEYVDAIVGAVIDRLKAEGLYDQALVVVTSDHGVSFRPGYPFKGLDKENVADVMSVPLLIKAPHQSQGRIDDGNMQSIDVMPTIAELLKIPLTWTADGHAGGGGPNATQKNIRHGGARLRTTVEADVLAGLRDASVARKVALFGEGPGWRSAAAVRRDLIGQRVDKLEVTEGPWQATMEDAGRLFTVDPSGATVPGLLSGRVRDARGAPLDANVAVAVNGVVAAVASTSRATDANRGYWAALVNPALFIEGRNDVRVYVIPADEPRLHLAYSSRVRPERLNLASRGAEEFWAVRQSGFYPREGEPIPHRWTTGEGILVVPTEAEQPARSLRIGLTGVRAGGTQLTVTLNECTLFTGRIDTTPWYHTFSLRACPAKALAQPYATISVKSPSWVNPADQQARGVAVETVNLFADDWPLAPGPGEKARASVSLVKGQPREHVAGTPVSIVVANLGTSTWPAAEDAPAGDSQVLIALRWQRAGASGPTHEQRMDLPYTMYPTDRVLIEAPMVPPDLLRSTGPWKVTITPIASDGTPIPADRNVVVDVNAAGR
jgi:hypothetical protein